MSSSDRFRVQLRDAIAKAKEAPNQLVRKVILDMGTRVVELTPVGDATLWKHPAPAGYVGGRARANWQYGNLAGAGIPEQPLPDIDATGRASIDRIAAGIPEQALGTVHYVVNSLPYIRRLEDGWSRQAPSGMVGITVIEFGGIVEARAQEVRQS